MGVWAVSTECNQAEILNKTLRAEGQAVARTKVFSVFLGQKKELHLIGLPGICNWGCIFFFITWIALIEKHLTFFFENDVSKHICIHSLSRIL
jgi:hypothetical protein